MTRPDNDELKRLAEGATPGPWTCKEGSTAYPECDDKDFWAVVLSPAGKEVVTLYERSSFDDRADYDFDAAFIAAANPAVVLALLSEIEGWKEAYDRSTRLHTSTCQELIAALSEIEALKARAMLADMMSAKLERRTRLLDEAERQLAALRTQAPDSWRPIETAPKDGTAILAGSIHHETREVVCWQDGMESGSLEAIVTGLPQEGWVNDGPIKDRFYANPNYFTHWQTIALRPQTAESGK